MNILAICAHPDDETLGCGGTLLRHQAAGDELHWAIVTQAQPPQWSPELIERKSKEIDAVAASYSMRSVHRLRLPTTQLDNIPLSQVIDGLREPSNRFVQRSSTFRIMATCIPIMEWSLLLHFRF